MYPRLIATWDKLRASYWFVPALMTSASIILALALTALDAALSDAAVNRLAWVYSGGPEGARALLSTVAGSVITVAGTTFSILIAALTLASSQFGPRLLRTFVRDTSNQVVLGTFIATFMYCLLVLRTVRGLEDTRVVPHISVTVAVLLAICSIGVLIYFIHHAATSIQADYVIAAVGHDLDSAIDRLFPEPVGHGPTQPERPTSENPPGEETWDGTPLPAKMNGYLQMIDAERLMHFAAAHDLVIRLGPQPGDFVVAGSTLVEVWPTHHANDEATGGIMEAFVIGSTRTHHQDVRFTINQLVEIAVRALSPGVNDPFTAMSCLDQLGAAFCRLAGRLMPDANRYDDTGRLRVVAPALSFAELFELAFGPIRHYGRSDPRVLLHVLRTVGVVGACMQRDDQAAALWGVIEQVRQAGVALPNHDDRAQVQAMARACANRINSRFDSTAHYVTTSTTGWPANIPTNQDGAPRDVS